jgi:lipoprotein-releasing system permease protein
VKLPLRLAWRYAWASRSKSLTHLISGISMFVIAAVTAAMIAILSAFNGIEEVVSDLFGTLDAPVAIVPITGTDLPNEVGAWVEQSFGAQSKTPLIEFVAPVIEGEAIVSWAGNQPHVCAVLAFDSLFLNIAPITSAVRSRTWNPAWSQSPACLVVGLGVKNILGLNSIHDESQRASLLLRAPIPGKKLARHKEKAFQAERAFVCDVFSINAEIDRKYILGPIDFARTLFSKDSTVSRYELGLATGVSEDEAAHAIRTRIAAENLDWQVRTRSEKNKLITQTNRAEKWATFVILSFILVVAAFNVMASLTMMLLDKRQDMEVLNALGLTGWKLEQVFALQGVLINTVGGVVGAVVGTLLVLGQQTFGWVKLQGSVIPSYPVALEMFDVVGTLTVVVIIGGIGSGWMVRNLVHRFV